MDGDREEKDIPRGIKLFTKCLWNIYYGGQKSLP